jgi:PAS domain S-box-containing protein
MIERISSSLGAPGESPACRILVVEDNPATLKMLRFVLEADGYAVAAAPDARTALADAAAILPDLVLQDLILPDMDGFELVRHLRALPGGAEMPILALSGFLGRLEEARSTEAGFTALLVKPILPSQLLESIRPYLRRQPDLRVLIGEGRRLLIVDDDVVQLKLDRIHFSQLGFAVTTAATAAEGLRLAAAAMPDVALCDVFMADADGFQFCLEVRSHPTLKGLPVVLVSAQHGTDSDRDLAKRVGASAFVLRTPGFEDAAAALLDALKSGIHVQVPGSAVSDQIRLQHATQVIKRLERQLEITSSIVRQNSHQAAQLALLSGVSALTLNENIDVALRDMLGATLDAAGISKGALFLRDAGGVLRVRQAIGFSVENGVRLEACLGRMAVLDDMIDRGSVVSVPSKALADEVSRELLSGGGVASAQIVPLVTDGHGVGAIIIAATRADVSADGSIAFARAMGNQLVQSLELAKSVERLTASEARYRTLLESASDAIAVVTPGGVIHEVNHRWEEIVGRSRQELIGRRIRDFAAPLKGVPDALGEGALPPGSRRTYPLAIVHADGSARLMEFSETPVDIGGDSFSFVVGRDVTERRALEEQLRQAQKLEAIGRLAGGAAHDFNNVLTAILGFCHMLLEDVGDTQAARRDLLEIQKAGQRATGLTKQLLAFSRQQVLQPQIHQINALVTGVHPMLERLIFENIEFCIDLQPDAGLIKIDMLQLEQILINLVVNARDAMPRGGRLTIRTSGARVDGKDCVVLTVADSGVGMDEDTQRHLFEPFFTTKGIGKGTGLGLSTVYGIVKQSGGNISVSSEPGRGSTFTIQLPKIESLAPDLAQKPVGVEVPGGSETVLVVEDDPAVRRLAAMALGRSGYRVLEAGSPREADQVALAFLEPIHLLVSDVVMPESEGAPLIERLKVARPALRVLYMSGYADETVAKHGILLAKVPFLQKPFTRPGLARKVREVLDA